MGRWGDGEMGRWGDGGMGRWGVGHGDAPDAGTGRFVGEQAKVSAILSK
ncbi:hypothetical protein [Okeania sp. KiyG1]|nr:hypothetical protein [Okeania sp. KiyG1]